jgi:hypothetical protein
VATLSLTHLRGAPAGSPSALNKSDQASQASLAALSHVNYLDFIPIIALLDATQACVHTLAPAAFSDVASTH